MPAAPFRLSPLTHLVRRLASPWGLALWFVLCALPTGLGYVLLTPVGMASDELEHCARADGLLHGEISGRRPPPGYADYSVNAGVRIDNGMVAVLFSKEFIDARNGGFVWPADRRLTAEYPWFAGTAYYPTQMVEYFPVMYLPGAAGLLLGKWTGLRPYSAFFLGRTGMLLAFAALGAMATGLARFGNGLIFALLSLPTTINLAASYNEDGLIIACCALAAALLSRCRPGASWHWFAALALLTAVGSAKTPYAALLLLCLPPLPAPKLAWRAVWIGLAGVLPGLWLLHCFHFGFIAYHRAPYHPGPLWPGRHDVTLQSVVPADNLRVLLDHPVQILRLPLASFARHWGTAWPLLLAGMLDGVHIDAWEYPCLTTALLAAACAALYSRPGTWRWPDAAVGALILFTTFIGIELSLYLSWTNVGLTQVEGVNPRYFLPLLPFFIFLLPAAGGGLRRLPGVGLLRVPAGWLYLPAMVMALVNVFVSPVFLFHLFRMPGP